MDMKELHKEIGAMSSKIDDMHKCLFGNGRPGLRDRLQAVETSQANCQKAQKARKIDAKFVITAIIAIAAICSNFFK